MDESQAVQVVVDRLSGPDSLPMQLHRSEFVDEAQVSELFDALTVLARLYRGRSSVPKPVALALVDIAARFDNRFYTPAQQDRLEDIAHEVQRLAEELFSSDPES